MEFFRQEYWNGLSFPSPGSLPVPGIDPESLASPVLAGRFCTTAPPGKPYSVNYIALKKIPVSNEGLHVVLIVSSFVLTYYNKLLPFCLSCY